MDVMAQDDNGQFKPHRMGSRGPVVTLCQHRATGPSRANHRGSEKQQGTLVNQAGLSLTNIFPKILAGSWKDRKPGQGRPAEPRALLGVTPGPAA